MEIFRQEQSILSPSPAERAAELARAAISGSLTQAEFEISAAMPPQLILQPKRAALPTDGAIRPFKSMDRLPGAKLVTKRAWSWPS